MEAEQMATTTTRQHPELLSSPWFMIGVLIIYLLFVTLWGPKLMKERKPFELKNIIIVHNVVQVLSCIYVVYEILQITENQIVFFWICQPAPQTNERKERHFRLAYFLFWLKISELIETVIFVLRKKQNQVSKLHVFHHIATITLIYLLINHNNSGLYSPFVALFPIFLNSKVHIIMYSYYLTAAIADKRTIRALTPLKKSITVIQMVQFFFILLQACVVMYSCGVPRPVFSYFCVVIAVMFYGFYDFYKTSYNNAQRRKSLAAQAKEKQ